MEEISFFSFNNDEERVFFRSKKYLIGSNLCTSWLVGFCELLSWTTELIDFVAQC